MTVTNIISLACGACWKSQALFRLSASIEVLGPSLEVRCAIEVHVEGKSSCRPPSDTDSELLDGIADLKKPQPSLAANYFTFDPRHSHLRVW